MAENFIIVELQQTRVLARVLERARRTKHGYADSDILSTAGITDPVERVHCKVLRLRS